MYSAIFFTILIFILSTPKIYSATNVGGRISTDTTWTKANSPYIVTSTVQIYGDAVSPAKLTIEAGTEVRFGSGCSLQIGSGANKGILQAIGTETDTTKFTANTTIPTRGYWGRIIIDDNSIDYDSASGNGTILTNCLIEYGGQSANNGNISAYNSSPKISKCIIKESLTNGINITGISSGVNITENNITNNGANPIAIMPNALSGIKGDNSLIGNGQDIVLIYGEIINNYPNSLKEIKFREIGIPYLVTGGITIIGRNDYKIAMVVEPGVEIRFNKNTAIDLYNGPSTYPPELKAIGSAEKRIKFTSAQIVKNKGDWYGIWFRAGNGNATSELKYCAIEYGGGTSVYPGNIYLNGGARINISSCVIKESKEHGVCNGTGFDYWNNTVGIINIDNCEIRDNAKYGVWCNF